MGDSYEHRRCIHGLCCRLVLLLDCIGCVVWEVPPGVLEGGLLFQTCSAFLHEDCLTFVEGLHGWSVAFTVCLLPGYLLLFVHVKCAGEG